MSGAWIFLRPEELQEKETQLSQTQKELQQMKEKLKDKHSEIQLQNEKIKKLEKEIDKRDKIIKEIKKQFLDEIVILQDDTEEEPLHFSELKAVVDELMGKN